MGALRERDALVEAEQPASPRRFVLDHDLDVRHRVAKLLRQRVDDLLHGPLEVERLLVHLRDLRSETTKGRSRGPQSLYGSTTSRPAIATPSGRSVCFTRIESPCAASTSGKRLYTSGASSAPPPTSTMPCSRRRACTAGQSTRPGETCSSTQTLRTRAAGWSGPTPLFGAPAVELIPPMLNTRAPSP